MRLISSWWVLLYRLQLNDLIVIPKWSIRFLGDIPSLMLYEMSNRAVVKFECLSIPTKFDSILEWENRKTWQSKLLGFVLTYRRLKGPLEGPITIELSAFLLYMIVAYRYTLRCAYYEEIISFTKLKSIISKKVAVVNHIRYITVCIMHGKSNHCNKASIEDAIIARHTSICIPIDFIQKMAGLMLDSKFSFIASLA